MGFLNLFRKADMTKALALCQADENAVLLDVRTAEEYARGHIPGSRNIPLDRLSEVRFAYRDLETPVYLYCLSGARSSFAADEMKRWGYCNVTDLGGLSGYHGKVEC